MSYRMPAEWEPHEACWVAWPSHEELWGEDLPGVQDEFVALCRTITDGPNDRRESLKVLVPDSRRESEAAERLRGLPVSFLQTGFGDIWLRDTGPVFVFTDKHERLAACFRFNGWGEKYDLPHDKEVSGAIAHASGDRPIHFPWILEGGSIEVDGEGTCLTTEQCLLNRNRNAELSRDQVEQGLRSALGVSQILWLGDGLLNDHTDGHIDTLARFIAPGKVVCMAPSGKNDPNTRVLETIATSLSKMRDAKGRTLEVVRIPGPGRLEEDGKVMPASYVNFYISNTTVAVPVYGQPSDEAALKALEALFPGRRVVGLSSRALLRGGGAFHCITQQQPRRESR